MTSSGLCLDNSNNKYTMNHSSSILSPNMVLPNKWEGQSFEPVKKYTKNILLIGDNIGNS